MYIKHIQRLCTNIQHVHNQQNCCNELKLIFFHTFACKNIALTEEVCNYCNTSKMNFSTFNKPEEKRKHTVAKY